MREYIKKINYALKTINSTRKEHICSKSGFDVIELESLAAQAISVMHRLCPRHRDILVKRYGLDGNSPKTLEAIAREYQLTRERIRQIQYEAIKKMLWGNIKNRTGSRDNPAAV